MKKIFTLPVLVCFLNFVVDAQSFTPGNLVVFRSGDGAAALTDAATPAFLDEWTPGGLLIRSVALPTTASGSNRIMTVAGSATTEGVLSRTPDKKYIMFAGYNAPVGTAAVSGTTAATINRIVGKMDANFNLDATTALTDFASVGNPRSVFSYDGIGLWISGSAGGVRYTTLGSTSSTQLSNTETNIRVTTISGGQLYVSSAAGAIRVATVGTGAPTSPGQTITNLPGTPATGLPNGFFFADLSAAVPGADVLYVADEVLGAIKYSLVGGTWISNDTVPGAVRGMTGIVSGINVTLFATSSNVLFTITDAGGYNAAFSGTRIPLAIAPVNTDFRGITLTPEMDPIPIKLEYIKGHKTNTGNVLNWKLTCLSAKIVMEIEKAADTRNFKPVVAIAATQARCSEPFDFTDARPLQGKNYYRLKMIDIDGKISYSPIVAILNGAKGIEFVGLYPSIVKNETSLSVSSSKATTIETKITDVNGRLIKTYRQAIPSGSSLITIDCSNLAAGIYNLTGISEDAPLKTIRFVKQ